MSYEVEIKAKVDDKLSLVDELNKRFGPFTKVEKKDTYYNFKTDEDFVTRCRIRVQGEDLIITTKQKNIKDGFECNKEIEFIHPKKDLETIDEFFKNLGLKILREKEKSGYEWQSGDMHIELLDVKHLGFFLETEIISDTNDEKEVDLLNKKLLSFYESLGIDKEMIEKRAYNQMLKELGF